MFPEEHPAGAGRRGGLFLAIAALLVLLLFPAVRRAAAPDAGAGESTHLKIRRAPYLTPPARAEPGTGFPPRFWEAPPPVPPAAEPPLSGSSGCLRCHRGVFMPPPHNFSCVTCHGGDADAAKEESAHRGLIRNPGDLAVAERTCGRCHPRRSRAVFASRMATASGMIAQVRFAFGAQREPGEVYSTHAVGRLKLLPDPESSGRLVDDLLRRKCLRCHLMVEGSKRYGEVRSSGCSACHVPYSNDPGDPKPYIHTITARVGITACLKCHNSNHVGADYVGLFEQDYERGFRAPAVAGHAAPFIYGAGQHRLSPDVHFEASLWCIDCHTGAEVMGMEGARPPSCESCHGGRGRRPRMAVRRRSDGRELSVPPFTLEFVAHRVRAHRGHRCSACHAAWSYQDYGLHLIREDYPNYWKWDRLARQNDPQVQGLLLRNIGTAGEILPPAERVMPAKSREEWEEPRSRDWLTGEMKKGIWYHGHSRREWEDPPLGIDEAGKVAIFRPVYQYFVSYVDEERTVRLDSVTPTAGNGGRAMVWNPYEPHTIGRVARRCHECHGDPKAAGLGRGMVRTEKGRILFTPLGRHTEDGPGMPMALDAMVAPEGRFLMISTHPGARPFYEWEWKRLLVPTERYRAMMLEDLLSRMPMKERRGE